MYCSNCGEKATGNFCAKCGFKLNDESVDTLTEEVVEGNVKIINGISIDMDEVWDKYKDKIQAINYIRLTCKIKIKEAKDIVDEFYDSKDGIARSVKCPKCGSTNISANKKGVGVGKAVVGAIVAGPLGLLAGGLGKNKVLITCLNCGNQFKPGK